MEIACIINRVIMKIALMSKSNSKTSERDVTKTAVFLYEFFWVQNLVQFLHQEGLIFPLQIIPISYIHIAIVLYKTIQCIWTISGNWNYSIWTIILTWMRLMCRLFYHSSMRFLYMSYITIIIPPIFLPRNFSWLWCSNKYAIVLSL